MILKITIYMCIFLLSSYSTAREPMVRYPGEFKHASLSRKVDVDFSSSLNTQDPDQVEFDIGEEMPSYNKPMVSTGTLR